MPKIPRPSLDSFNDLVLKQWRNGHQQEGDQSPLVHSVFAWGLCWKPVPNFDVFFQPAAQNPLI